MKAIRNILLLSLVVLFASCASLETPQGDTVEVYVSWNPGVDESMGARVTRDRSTVTRYTAKLVSNYLEQQDVCVEMVEPGFSADSGPAIYTLELNLTSYSIKKFDSKFTVAYDLKNGGKSVLSGSLSGEGAGRSNPWQNDAQKNAQEIGDAVYQKILKIHNIVVE